MQRRLIWWLSMSALIACVVGCGPSRTLPSPGPRPTRPVVVARPSPVHIAPSITPHTTPTILLTTSFAPSATPSPSPTWTPAPPLVAIDPGHGGRDLGAVRLDAQGHLSYTESQVNLELALRVRDLLLDRGYRVFLTRTEDVYLNEAGEDINGDGRVDFLDELQLRVDMVNAARADLLLSIHQNAFYTRQGKPHPDVGGTITFYCAVRPFSDHSLRLAEQVQAHLVAAFISLGYDIHDRGVQEDLVLQVPGEPGDHLVMLGPRTPRIVRPSEMPGVLSETLFITHQREGELARDPVALDRLALAYADAISAYLQESAPVFRATQLNNPPRRMEAAP